MGCCYRLDTDVILANLFEGSSYPVKYSYDDVHEYFRFLSERFPTYLSTNLSEHELYVCADEFYDLYSTYKDKDGEVYIESKDYKPNLDYFNCRYSFGLRHYLGDLTKEYLEQIV